jgi:4-diphosphocytidyl-2C-methyl-D-erythritol kinase
LPEPRQEPQPIRRDTTSAIRLFQAGEKALRERNVDSIRLVARAYGVNPPPRWDFINSFDGPVMAQRPDIAAVRDLLVGHGALAARLTGSGSTVFGLFADREEARACAAALGAGPLCAGDALVAALDPLASLPAVW